MKLHTIYNIIKLILDLFLRQRPLYSIWFNFKTFPFSLAIKLPVIFYPHAYAKIDRGGIINIDIDHNRLRYNKIYIGQDIKDFSRQCEKTYIHVGSHGSLTFHGKVDVRRGTLIDVSGNLDIGENVIFASLVRCRCFNCIKIGAGTVISHESQIFDTNFHFLKDINTGVHSPVSKPIIIGDFCWIANRAAISSGCVLPNHTIVASNSLVNKDMSDIGQYTLLAGTPCRIVRRNVTRVWETNLEYEYLIKELGYNPYL